MLPSGELALDISNYTGPLSPAILAAWKARGIGLLIVQAVTGANGVSDTRQQLQAAADAWIPTDAYLYLFGSDSQTTMRQRVALADGFTIGRWWLDVEDPSLHGDPQAKNLIAAALALLDTLPSQRGAAGIYTSPGEWAAIWPGANPFTDRPLWPAEWTGAPGSAFVPFGGWTTCELRQYTGSAVVSGVGGVDQDVTS